MSKARALRLVALASTLTHAALAEPVLTPAASPRVPTLAPPPNLQALVGRPVTRVLVVGESGRLVSYGRVTRVHPGQPFSPDLARQGLRDLLDSGRFASARIEVENQDGGVVLRYVVLPRRVIRRIDLAGAPFPRDELFGEGAPKIGDDLTFQDLPRIAALLESELERRGYPAAHVTARSLDTDDPLNVVLLLDVRAGPELRLQERWFGVWPDPHAPGLHEALSGYDVDAGDRADAVELEAADEALAEDLKDRGFFRATVSHRLVKRGSATLLDVDVRAGPLIRLVFEGNHAFDADALEEALDLDDSEERDPVLLADRVRDFYLEHGYLDATVVSEERGAADAGIHELVFRVREGAQVRVVAREYPCLSGDRTPSDVGSEIDSFLSDLPGSELIGPVDEAAVGQVYGPDRGYGPRRARPAGSPWTRYAADVYDKAIEHLKDLFRAQGYLSASVGPATLVRRTCDPYSPPGACRAKGPRLRPATECRYDAVGLPVQRAPQRPRAHLSFRSTARRQLRA